MQPRPSQGFRDLQLLAKRSNRLPRIVSMKEAMNSLSNSPATVVDLTGTTPVEANPRGVLKTIPVKFLKFAEDVRPPYIGTYTKCPTRGSISTLARNPLGHVRPDTNYGYDSEAEWEDPVDGEDLNSEGEEEEEDEDEEEMEGFLDDEEPNAIKRRPLLGDQEPTCSGICWEGESHPSNGRLVSDLSQYRIDVLLGKYCCPDLGQVLIFHQKIHVCPSTLSPQPTGLRHHPRRRPTYASLATKQHQWNHPEYP